MNNGQTEVFVILDNLPLPCRPDEIVVAIAIIGKHIIVALATISYLTEPYSRTT